MTKKCSDKIKIVDNSYSDEEGKKSWYQQINFDNSYGTLIVGENTQFDNS